MGLPPRRCRLHQRHHRKPTKRRPPPQPQRHSPIPDPRPRCCRRAARRSRRRSRPWLRLRQALPTSRRRTPPVPGSRTTQASPRAPAGFPIPAQRPRWGGAMVDKRQRLPLRRRRWDKRPPPPPRRSRRRSFPQQRLSLARKRQWRRSESTGLPRLNRRPVRRSRALPHSIRSLQRCRRLSMVRHPPRRLTASPRRCRRPPPVRHPPPRRLTGAIRHHSRRPRPMLPQQPRPASPLVPSPGPLSPRCRTPCPR